jgi:hypothetical protein
MPHRASPIRTRLRITSASVLFFVLGAALGGCSGGDFGRSRQSVLSDDMHRWIGGEATASVGLHASEFALTDRERLMRDQAYQLIEPPQSRPLWKSVFGDYRPLPAPWRQNAAFDRTAYGKLLIDEPHRSPTSRYNVLTDDVRSDIVRLEPFYANAARVAELDAKRNASLRLVSTLSPREREDALARMDENALIVQWVDICLQRRVSSYRWALERLVIQTPDNIAGSADMLIGKLEAQSTTLAVKPQASRGAVLK